MTRLLALLLVILAVPTHAGWGGAKGTVGVGASAGPAGGSIAIDAGFPSSTWLNDQATVSTMTTPTFTTGGATRTLVAVVAWYTPSNDPFPATVAWVGGTPAGATAWSKVIDTNDAAIHWITQVWIASATSTLTDASVVATRSNPDRSTAILSVYSISGAQTSAGASAEHHSTSTEVGNNVYVTSVDVPITATASGSLIIGVSQYGDFYSDVTGNSLTTIDYQQHDSGSDGGAAAWHKTTGTAQSGNYTLGVDLPSGDTRAFSGCAVEILAQ